MASTPATLRAAALLLATCGILAADPIRFSSAEATFHAGDEKEFLKVIDGVAEGPSGWSPAPKVSEPHALVVHCERPVEADELDIDLFFLAGRASNAVGEFSLSYTTDEKPSLDGNWQPLEITRFAAEVGTLRRTEDGRLHLEFFQQQASGTVPDDVFHVQVRLPGKRASGFRLDVFPVKLPWSAESRLSWWPPHDFTLTEFRVAVRSRETTNIALHQPVSSSHPLFHDERGYQQSPASLTDGLPATMAHPHEPILGSIFHFEIDLGRDVVIDHINLRNRADFGNDRMSKMSLRLYDGHLATGAPTVWEGLNRADGSHPEPGAVDVVRADAGTGVFRGRYLRLSSESPIPHSPQLAEVEVYETRTPVLVSAKVDGRPLAVNGSLQIPPGTRRLSMQLAIPQSGKPPGNAFRWRMSDDSTDWQEASQFTIDMACPQPGEHVFEAQALHSDNVWDASVFRLPILVRQHAWENRGIQASGFSAAIVAAVLLSRWVNQRRTARQVAAANARAALAEERARIARDLHDDLGANLAEIAMISELARESLPPSHPARGPLEKIFDRAEGNTRRLGEIVWAVNPANDTLEHFTKYLCKFAQDYLSSAHIRCRFDLPETMPPGSFSAAQRYHLLLAAKEAIHNAARHGHPGTVTLKLGVDDGVFTVEIHDDGRGCDPSAAAASPRGCGNMRLRMETIGGRFAMKSVPGSGTRVSLVTPFSP